MLINQGPVDLKKLLALGMCFVLSLGLSIGYTPLALARPAYDSEDPPVEPQVMQALNEDGEVRVVVALNLPAAAQSLQARSQALSRAQVQVLSNVTAWEFQLVHRYSAVPGLVGVVTPRGLEQLRRSPDVRAIALDMPVEPATIESAALIRADRVWKELGMTGAGVNIAVIDSGIDVHHPDLVGSLVAQHCFTQEACLPGRTNESAYAQDEHGHGTRVAGVITSDGLASPKGIAPDAGIVAVRVMDALGAGWTSDVIAAIDWVVADQERLNIKVINLSLGGNLYHGVCDRQDANTMLYADALLAAREAGITVFAASGNQGQQDALIAPACISSVVAVGSTYDANLGPRSWNTCVDNTTMPDRITCFSNSDVTLDLLAPGAWIDTAALGGGRGGDAGTSMAAPQVAAVAALMLQAEASLQPADIESRLKQTGVPVTDIRDGRVTPRIDAFAAVSPLVPATPVPPLVLSGSVRLQGRTNHSGTNVRLSTLPCNMPPSDGALNMLTDAQGYFEFALDSGHPYQCVYITRTGSLKGQGVLPDGIGALLELPGGDVVEDDVINIFDLARIASQLGRTTSEVDLNADGVVNILDLAMTAGNYGRQGPVTNWE